MGLNDTQLTLISYALFRNGSPTNELFTKLESSNATISQLYRILALMKHQRAMFLLKPFVDEKLKALCPDLGQDDHQLEEFRQQFDGNPIANNISINNKFITNNDCYGGNDSKFGISLCNIFAIFLF